MIKHLGNFQFNGVPECAQNRLADIRNEFSSAKAATALIGIYVVLVVYLEDKWQMRPFTTSYKKGRSCEQHIVGKDKILSILGQSDCPESAGVVADFMESTDES